MALELQRLHLDAVHHCGFSVENSEAYVLLDVSLPFPLFHPPLLPIYMTVAILKKVKQLGAELSSRIGV